MAVLVDTNILVRVRQAGNPHQAACQQVLEPVAAARLKLCVCAQTIIEYWVVATRPVAQNGGGLTPAEAGADVDMYLARLPCLPEPPDVAARWLRLVKSVGVSGKPAHDARLVALMQAHALRRLLTLNPGDFARYPNVECVTPDQLIAGGP